MLSLDRADKSKLEKRGVSTLKLLKTSVEIEQDEFDFAISGEVPGDSEATRTLWLKTTEWLTVNLGDTLLDDWPTILPV